MQSDTHSFSVKLYRQIFLRISAGRSTQGFYADKLFAHFRQSFSYFSTEFIFNLKS